MNRAFYMLLFTFSLYGCNVKMSQKVNETLYQAENCMEEFPDSALSLLQHISHPEDLKGKAQADYALFYSLHIFFLFKVYFSFLISIFFS